MARYDDLQPGMDAEGLDSISTPMAWDRRQAFVSAPLEHDMRHMARGDRTYWAAAADLQGQPFYLFLGQDYGQQYVSCRTRILGASLEMELSIVQVK